MIKDTVMNEEQIVETMDKAEGYDDTLRWRSVLPAQAEKSFKAGEVEGYKQGLEMREPYKAGIKLVVDWINTNNKFHIFGFEDGSVLIYAEDWMAKDWGIDEERTH